MSSPASMRVEASHHAAPDVARSLHVEISVRTLAATMVAVAAAWALIKLIPVVLVVVVALFLAGTLTPTVERLVRYGVRRFAAIALVFTALLVLFVFFSVVTIPALVAQVSDVAEREPSMRAHLIEYLSHSRVGAPLADSLRNVHYENMAKAAAPTAWAYSISVVGTVAYAVSSVFLSLYMMIDRNRLRGGTFALVPRRYHVRFARVLLHLETIVGGYIRGQVITSSLMVAFTFVVLTLCRVPNAIVLAVFAGVVDVLPYIGVFLSVGPAVLACYLARGATVALVLLVIMLVYEEFESRVLVPRVYGNTLRLPSSVVLVSLLIGSTLLGVLGALLALPMAAAVRMIVEEMRVALPGEPDASAQSLALDQQVEQEYEQRTVGLTAEAAAGVALALAKRRQALLDDGAARNRPTAAANAHPKPETRGG